MRKNLFKATKVAILVAATFLLVTISGCGQIAGDGVSGDVDSGNRTLTGYINGVGGAKKAKAGRSILPTMPDFDELDFYLYGEASNGEKTKNGGTVSWIQIETEDGSFSLDLGPYYWNLTLIAVEKGSAFATAYGSAASQNDLAKVKSTAWLIGYCNVDLTRSSATANFILTADGLTTPGFVLLKVSLDDWTLPSGVKMKLGVYDAVTRSPVKVAGGTGAVEYEYEGTGGAALAFPVYLPDDATAANFSATTGNAGAVSVNSGSYYFGVEFIDSTGSDVWGDDIMVVPGKTTKKEIIIPKIYGVAPTGDPSSFAVYYNTTTPEKVMEGKYDAVFTWVDGTTGESEYEIEIADVTDITNLVKVADTTSDTNWTSYVTDKSFPTVTYDSTARNSFKGVYVDGSLFANSTSVTLRLDLEKRYTARIRAKNRAGESAWAYVELDDTNVPAGCAEFKGDVINLYKITYDLKGGVYDPDVTPSSGDEIYGKIIDYGTKDLAYRDTIDETNLKRGGKSFVQWNNAEDDTKYDVSTGDYDGEGNLELYAVYALHNITIANPNDYAIDPAWITAGNTTQTALVDTNSTGYPTLTLTRHPTNTASFSADYNKNFTWTITIPDATTLGVADFTGYDSLTVDVPGCFKKTIYEGLYDNTITIRQSDAISLPDTFQATISVTIGIYTLKLPITVYLTGSWT